ncbi:hypothetical protein BaRGS_00016882 [Batillaria attramentaria]|uniref:Uncharacterized protein n=1 Tax=Batillaria attramentaria TaxID=370345 RepID=A0ABD0KXH7_9CAEN
MGRHLLPAGAAGFRDDAGVVGCLSGKLHDVRVEISQPDFAEEGLSLLTHPHSSVTLKNRQPLFAIFRVAGSGEQLNLLLTLRQGPPQCNAVPSSKRIAKLRSGLRAVVEQETLTVTSSHVQLRSPSPQDVAPSA